MVKSLAQTQPVIKPIVIDTPFLLGLADGRTGRSLYDGYNLFCSQRFLQYERGWQLAQRRIEQTH